MGLIFYPLAQANSNDSAWFHALYDDAFPDFEKRTRQGQDHILLFAERYQAQLILNENIRVGLLGGWLMNNGFYIEHFAIDGTLRGRNLGQQAMATIVARYGRVILEIDPPVDDLSRRRLAFYQRCGFVSNPFEHIHPNYKPRYAPHSLMVLSYPEALSAHEYQTFSDILNREVMATDGL